MTSAQDSNEKPIGAVVATLTNDDPFSLLAFLLNRSGFWRHLEKVRSRRKVSPADFQILIKPDMWVFDAGSPTGTDPRLVENLIAQLHDRGFTQVSVGCTTDSASLWLENRDVLMLAELAGYRFRTDSGRDYDILDLSENVVPVAFPESSVLEGSGLSSAWVDADYRICFAKNRTDEENAYALCFESMLGILPLRDKEYHYRHRLPSKDVCTALHKQTPFDFNLIDAITSNHGAAGHCRPCPLETRTLIASESTLLADWVGAIKMGVDPYSSAISASALRSIGLPKNYTVDGSLEPYPKWVNVHPLVLDSVRGRNEWFEARRLMTPLLLSVNRDLFPFKDMITDRVNAVVTRFLSHADQNPIPFSAAVGLNYAASAMNKCLEAKYVMLEKDNLRYRHASINYDVSADDFSAIESVVGYLEPLADLIRCTPEDHNGLRWRYLDGSVLFEFSRVIPVAYSEFVDKVDICKAIGFMNDFIGGNSLAVARDRSDRVTHQIERNIYLPQPNYLILYQGTVIDVTKLDYVRYSDTCQQIFWKTVISENESATHDDGIITFEETHSGDVNVSVMGRQEFRLPLFWQAVNLDLNPLVKDFLVRHAYTTFFTRTFSNFEALCEGRNIRVGRPWSMDYGEDESSISHTTEKVLDLVGHAVGALSPLLRVLKSTGGRDNRSGGIVDENGFRHFRPREQLSPIGPGARSDGIPSVASLQRVLSETFGTWNDILRAMERDMVSVQESAIGSKDLQP